MISWHARWSWTVTCILIGGLGLVVLICNLQRTSGISYTRCGFPCYPGGIRWIEWHASHWPANQSVNCHFQLLHEVHYRKPKSGSLSMPSSSCRKFIKILRCVLPVTVYNLFPCIIFSVNCTWCIFWHKCGVVMSPLFLVLRLGRMQLIFTAICIPSRELLPPKVFIEISGAPGREAPAFRRPVIHAHRKLSRPPH